MPRGRRPNLDKKIANLIASLKRTLVAKRAAEVMSAVGRQVDHLVHSLVGGTEVGNARAASPTAAPTTGKRTFSAATRAKMKRSQKARWAKLRTANAGRGAKRGAQPASTSRKASTKRVTKAKLSVRPKAGGGWAAMTPEQRAARIAKMQAGRTAKPGAKQ
jgi:hypothetical protein